MILQSIIGFQVDCINQIYETAEVQKCGPCEKQEDPLKMSLKD